MNTDSNGWNGTLNSLPLPADDYWFRLVLNENQIVNGHFSLKR
jgi:gliding motility-associated-like protein